MTEKRMKPFGLRVVVALWVLFISACGVNVEDCLQDESCGPVIQVTSHDGALPADPYDPFLGRRTCFSQGGTRTADDHKSEMAESFHEGSRGACRKK